MRKLLLSAFLMLSIFMLSSFTLKNYDAKETVSVNWMTLAEAYELQKKTPKYIIIDVYADWCGWCKKLDAKVYSHPEIVKYINNVYYPVKLDAEMKETVTINGRDFKYVQQGRSGAHELALELLDSQINLPSTVILHKDFATNTDKSKNEGGGNKYSIDKPTKAKFTKQVIPGYMEAEDMDKVLRYFGDGYVDKDIRWDRFQYTFKSRINKKKKRK